jgi:hypothetical protein
MSGKLYELVSVMVAEIRYTKPPIWTVSSFYLKAPFIGPPASAESGRRLRHYLRMFMEYSS